MILKILKLHSPRGSCNFENFQNYSYLLITNCTRGRTISYTNFTTGYLMNCMFMSPLQSLSIYSKVPLLIDCFHVTSSLSKIKNLRDLKVFILIKHKRWCIYICLQFYDSVACFVWKPEHFEFQGYRDA